MCDSALHAVCRVEGREIFLLLATLLIVSWVLDEIRQRRCSRR